MRQASPASLLALVKAQANMDESHHDPLLDFYVQAGRKQCERFTGVPLRLTPRRRTVTLGENGTVDLGEAPRERVTASWIGSDCCPSPARPVGASVAGSILSAHGLGPGARLDIAYEVGPANDDELLAAEPDLALGIVRFATHAYEHRGDTNMSSCAVDSGALDLWRTRQRMIST